LPRGDLIPADNRHRRGRLRCQRWFGLRSNNDIRGKTLEIEYTFSDPKSWEGEWKSTKRWQRVDDRDIAEVECLPEIQRGSG